MPVLTYEQLAQRLREATEQRDELADLLREAGEKLDRCLPAGGRRFLGRLEELMGEPS